MIASTTCFVSKGLQGMDSPYAYMNWYNTNFNMPVPGIYDGSTFIRYVGNANPISTGYSYNLSGFRPGYEICVGTAVYDAENNSGSTYYLNSYIYNRWTDPSLNTLFWGSNGDNFSSTLYPYYYSTLWSAANIGCADWEVAYSGTYHWRANGTGTPSFPTIDKSVTMSSVPSVATQGTAGYIWVEGDNLCFINANSFKHTMVGINIFNVPGASNAGFIWIDTINNIHWVGSSGYEFVSAWKIKQFESIFSNGSPGTVYAGTSKKGYMWMDNQYGYTHLAYIGNDGYKYLAGAAGYPY